MAGEIIPDSSQTPANPNPVRRSRAWHLDRRLSRAIGLVDRDPNDTFTTRILARTGLLDEGPITIYAGAATGPHMIELAVRKVLGPERAGKLDQILGKFPLYHAIKDKAAAQIMGYALARHTAETVMRQRVGDLDQMKRVAARAVGTHIDGDIKVAHQLEQIKELAHPVRKILPPPSGR